VGAFARRVRPLRYRNDRNVREATSVVMVARFAPFTCARGMPARLRGNAEV
jgi:hypothetical protein